MASISITLTDNDGGVDIYAAGDIPDGEGCTEAQELAGEIMAFLRSMDVPEDVADNPEGLH